MRSVGEIKYGVKRCYGKYRAIPEGFGASGLSKLAGGFGLQQLLPERFTDSIQWADIFSDFRL